MRRIAVAGWFALLTVVANVYGKDVVKGWARVETTPSIAEIAEEYATTDVLHPRIAALQIMKRQKENGIKHEYVPMGAEVEIQILPGYKVVGRGKIDKDGNYSISVPSTKLLWRAYCCVEREELGRRVRYVGATHVSQKSQYDSFYTGNIILKRSYASAEGRCVHKDGTPAQDVHVLVHPLTSGETDEECHLYPIQWAVTDAFGKWRVDGLSTPPIDILMSHICYTNGVNNWQVSHYPLQLGIYARLKPFGAYDAECIIPNVTDENHKAVEKAISAYERKWGKKKERSNQMTNFPASTNNVIYVPDLILP